MERLGRAAARAGRRVLIVRPFNVVGPGQSGAYGMVVPTFVRRALEGQPLEVYDDGRQTRCFSHVGAFVECLLRLVRAADAWARGAETVNVGCASPVSIGVLAEAVLEETGSRAGVRHLPYAAAFPGRCDVRSRVPDTSRLRALVGETEWPPLRAVVREVAASLCNGRRSEHRD
jgi:UDP-glucose 4-epimerase